MSRDYDDDDYTDAEAEEADAAAFEAHEDHDEMDLDCSFCVDERAAAITEQSELLRAQRLPVDVLLDLFMVGTPTAADREAAKRGFVSSRWALRRLH